MPELERGLEREWHEERRKEKWTNEREAWNKMKEVIDKYNGDPWQIPPEEGEEFRQAAELIIDTAEKDTDFKPKPNILNLAREIVKVIPGEKDEVAKEV